MSLTGHHHQGFVALHRGPETLELLKDPLAFAILALVALRARWKPGAFSADGLGEGEAQIGDHTVVGTTRQKFRTRLQKLETWGFLAIRTTNRGTIAKLLPRGIWSISDAPDNQQTNQQITIQQPTDNQRITTNEQGNKEYKETKKPRKEPASGSTPSSSLSASSLSAHRQFIDRWMAAYPSHHHGNTYAFQAGKDGQAVRHLLSTSRLEPEELMRVAVEAWAHPAKFHCASAASLTGFNSRFNEIRAELQTLRSGGNRPRFAPAIDLPPGTKPTGAYTAKSAI